MIQGVVNPKLEATVAVLVKDVNGQDQHFEAIIDTGFNGSLTLPPTIIRRLGLSWRTRGAAILANGASEQFDIYAAVLVWDGVFRNILVEEAEMVPLVGMALLRGYDLSLQVVPGGTVMLILLP